MTLNFGNQDFGNSMDSLNRFSNVSKELYSFKINSLDNIENSINLTDLYTLQPNYQDKGLLEREVIYYFDVIKSHSVQLQAQITDYWLENNTAVQDSINIAPIVLTLSGLVGEIVYKPPKFIDSIVEKLNNKFPQNNGFTFTQKLGAIPSLIPTVDNYTQMAKNVINYGENAYNRYKKIYDQVINWRKGNTSNAIPRQQQVYENFKYFWENKVPMLVNAPFGIFDSMYIQNVHMEQGETNTVSEITVTLKQLKFKEVDFTSPDKEVLASFNQQAQAETENLGKTRVSTLSLLGSKIYGSDFTNAGQRKPGQ